MRLAEGVDSEVAVGHPSRSLGVVFWWNCCVVLALVSSYLFSTLAPQEARDPERMLQSSAIWCDCQRVYNAVKGIAVWFPFKECVSGSRNPPAATDH